MKPPLTNIGVHLFELMLVKHRRGRITRCGALFTCLTTCALHIKLVEELDRHSFIKTGSFRFINRKRRTSDCGKDGTAWDLNPPNHPPPPSIATHGRSLGNNSAHS